MRIYLGTFVIAFATLALQITYTRILSVTAWYHIAFFAIATAMLGMTAGATHVYLKPKHYSKDNLDHNLTWSCLSFALSVPFTLCILCLVPLGNIDFSQMGSVALVTTTVVCALPFVFAGIAVTLVLTRTSLPVNRVYASDLAGASLGCLLVLGGLEIFDAPSLVLFCGSLGALAGLIFSWGQETKRVSLLAGLLFLLMTLVAYGNSTSDRYIRPVMVKGTMVTPGIYDTERWNSYSRILVYKESKRRPQYWGASPVAPMPLIPQRHLNIDGDAATTMRPFRTPKDIDHLRYDVTNVPYYLRPQGSACIIGVGGGRDVQSALAFGHTDITGIEINPIFIDLLQNEYREFAGIADHQGVKLVVDEARGYLSHTTKQYSLIQMSLIDTWAATGAGAFSLSENALYTIEAWQTFLGRLEKDGIFTVSRWYHPEELGESGRLLSLAVASLLTSGAENPSEHIALVTSGTVCTLMVNKSPFTNKEIEKLKQVCSDLQYQVPILPGTPVKHKVLKSFVAAKSMPELLQAARGYDVRYDPPTDESPYFFNMLRIESLSFMDIINLLRHHKSDGWSGVMAGNLLAARILLTLILSLITVAIATIFVPILFHPNTKDESSGQEGILWAGAIYFSLIGAGFMLVEIALMQRLSVLLSHPTYALGVLLFTIILSTGIGSFISEKLPLMRMPWVLIYPLFTAAAIMATSFCVSILLERLITEPISVKIIASVAVIFPMGILLGFFFPTGMRLVQSVRPSETPWYWALNGVFGVLFSAIAVFISIYVSVSMNLYIASACYLLVAFCAVSMYRQAQTQSLPAD